MTRTEPLSTARSGAVRQATITRERQPTAVSDVPEHPALAPNVELVGEMQETGFKDRQWLIQRNGRFIQVTNLLYRVAEQANGERTLEEIAEEVTAATEWMVTADHVRQLIQVKLMPLGLIATTDGSPVPRTRDGERSPLQINLRRNIIGPRLIEPIARVLQVLYAPPVVVPVLILIAVAHGWLYFVHGVADSVRVALYTPGGLLMMLVIVFMSGIFHELGHATALQYGGGRARGMGVGFYLVYPTFYTDTTDAYRLGRWARLRTDLGGIYFHLIFVLGVIALYFGTGEEVNLAVVLLINADILYQLLPYLRLDGYWALADLTGIPDFFSQMGAFLRSILPIPGLKGSKLPNLKRWVRGVFALYIILTIPVLTIFFFLMIMNFPRFMATALGALRYQTHVFSLAHSAGHLLTMAAVVSQVLFLTLSIVAGMYVLYNMSRRLIVPLWRWSKPTLSRRITGALITAAAVTLLAFLWIPQVSSVGRGIPAGSQYFEVTERDHVQEPVAYPQSPPVGGNHALIWQNCGFYGVPIASENAVHSMEHGAVWITYRSDVPEGQVNSLRRLARRQSYVLVSPFLSLTAPVVASAWGHQLHLDSVDDPRLDEFVRAFRLGPQAPEHGGPCTGGIGTPL